MPKVRRTKSETRQELADVLKDSLELVAAARIMTRFYAKLSALIRHKVPTREEIMAISSFIIDVIATALAECILTTMKSHFE